MTFIKLALCALVTLIALIATTCLFVSLRLRPLHKLTGTPQGSVGIDVALLSRMTIHSPLYWLAVIAILAAAGWLCRRWAF